MIGIGAPLVMHLHEASKSTNDQQVSGWFFLGLLSGIALVGLFIWRRSKR